MKTMKGNEPNILTRMMNSSRVANPVKGLVVMWRSYGSQIEEVYLLGVVLQSSYRASIEAMLAQSSVAAPNWDDMSVECHDIRVLVSNMLKHSFEIL